MTFGVSMFGLVIIEAVPLLMLTEFNTEEALHDPSMVVGFWLEVAIVPPSKSK